MLKSVLIVDDAAFMRMMLKNLIEKNGYQVVGEAGNGAEAIEKYQELRPELITMDVTMPELDGIRAIQEIKKINSRVKIIVISAMGREEVVREALLAGASSFIIKPFDEKKVVTTIERILS